MCGLCGVAGSGINSSDLEAYETLLWITSLRGAHSTGLMTYSPSGPRKRRPIEIHKHLGSSPDFLQSEWKKPPVSRAISSIFTEVFMGHCRHATVGSVSKENIHPFDTGTMVSAHNGTLVDAEYLKDDNKTDSQMMFEDMEKRGIKPVLEDLSAWSAYAISIFNKKAKTLTFARNRERGLNIAISKDSNVMFWASELAMLEFIAARHKLKVDYYTFEPDKIYTTSISSIRGKNHNFWDIKNLEFKTKSILTTGSSNNPIGAPWVDEDWCCVCGQTLWGRTLAAASQTVHNGTNYFTCRECQIPVEKTGKDGKEKIIGV